MLHQLWTNVINLCLAHCTLPLPLSPSLSFSTSPSDLHNCKSSELNIELATGNGNANALARAEIYFNKPCDNDKLIIWHFVATFRSCFCLLLCLVASLAVSLLCMCLPMRVCVCVCVCVFMLWLFAVTVSVAFEMQLLCWLATLSSISICLSGSNYVYLTLSPFSLHLAFYLLVSFSLFLHTPLLLGVFFCITFYGPHCLPLTWFFRNPSLCLLLYCPHSLLLSLCLSLCIFLSVS